MSLIYDLARLSMSGLKAQQSAQRDWSPYLVHFTSYTAMKDVRTAVKRNEPFVATDVKIALENADKKSWDVVKKILGQSNPSLQKNSPQAKEDLPKCVCLSQCTLPGVFGHSERFGRFGFVFEKRKLYDLGGRPCAYLEECSYGWLDEMHLFNTSAKRLWGIVNVYRPVGQGRVQDFTVEREWRVLNDIPLKDNLCAAIAPDNYVIPFRSLLAEKGLEVPVLPIDMLYDWGV